MSTEGQVPEGTTDTATLEAPPEIDVSGFEAQIAELTAQRDEAIERARVAETNKTRANQEAAERRVTLKSQQEVIETLNRENRQLWVDQWTKEACDRAGVDPDLAVPYLNANKQLGDIPISDRQSAVNQIEAGVQEFAERFPTTVARDETPDPWGTPDADGRSGPVSDIQAELERVMREEPHNFEAKWAELGGDQALNDGAFV